MFVNTNGARLFFDVAGKGVITRADGTSNLKPPCFALHGGPGGSHLDIRDSLDGISDLVQLVFHDQRGCGFSDKIPVEQLSMAAMSEDIERSGFILGWTEPASFSSASRMAGCRRWTMSFDIRTPFPC